MQISLRRRQKMNYVRPFFEAVGLVWGITIISVVIFGGVIFGLVQAGFLLDTANAHHQASIQNVQYQGTVNSQQYQQTYLEDLQKQIASLDAEDIQVTEARQSGDTGLVGELKVEEAAVAGKACQDASKLTPSFQDGLVDTATASWVSSNCTAGVVLPPGPGVPGSKYYIPTV
jgi:hypothetical protein